MSEPRKAHYLREWRESRKLRLSDMRYTTLKSPATLSKIEKGIYPYTESVIEGYARKIGIHPSSLLVHPDVAGEREQLIAILTETHALLVEFKRNGTTPTAPAEPSQPVVFEGNIQAVVRRSSKETDVS